MELVRNRRYNHLYAHSDLSDLSDFGELADKLNSALEALSRLIDAN